MNWGIFKELVSKELTDDDVIDVISVLDKKEDKLEIQYNSNTRGYEIISSESRPNYKGHNNPNNNL